MEFKILGPLEVTHDGQPLPLGGPQPRRLLAFLLLHLGHVVPVEVLAAAMIDGEWVSTTDPRAAVKTRLSDLRRVLRSVDAVTITSDAGGYQLECSPASLDVARFDELVAGGRRLMHHDPEAASATLRAALNVWRGPALPDFLSFGPALAATSRLEESRLGALEDRIEADLRLGRHAQLVDELAELVKLHPLRERLWGQQMMALYRAGRHVEALRAFQECRNQLAEHAGVEPGAALRDLERAILVQRPELRLGSGATQVPDSSVFVGRQRECDVMAAAAAPAAILFRGPTGIGKTRLLAELGSRAAADGWFVLNGQCEESAWSAPLSPLAHALGSCVSDLGDLVDALASIGPALAEVVPMLGLGSDTDGPSPIGLVDAASRLIRILAGGRPVFLALDDVQWADGTTLELVTHLLQSTPPFPVLVCATCDGHSVPLGVTVMTLEGLSSGEVAELLADLAPEVGGAERAESVAEQTGGNPFFVRELALHHAETDVPTAVQELVRRPLDRLSSDARRVVLVAAVHGSDHTPSFVGKATGLRGTRLDLALEEALNSGLLVACPLAHRAVAGTLDVSQLTRLSRRVNDAH
jgi:DNA-binding SARP family transcriptional activator